MFITLPVGRLRQENCESEVCQGYIVRLPINKRLMGGTGGMREGGERGRKGRKRRERENLSASGDSWEFWGQSLIDCSSSSAQLG